ncbi:MAG: glutamate--tRNA ligase [SAR202 cluster bacterium Io17-Chloro-G2]|nr:MAG: glutamate--tRNA ligase [SAR202 cluster bacterium Io17-Chloro-G2]
MSEHVRVRYAPSPTGEPHIGNIRTALFNWLFARHHGGEFLVRIEDTDQDRLVPGAVDAILEGLRWLEIDWDEGPEAGGPYGPYFQSERLELYQQAAEILLGNGSAYRCYCSRERLEQMRKDQIGRNAAPGYDGRCRSLTAEERSDLEAGGGPGVIRFAMPGSGVIGVQDEIRGYVEWQNDLLDDFVIMKSDGFPTYHLAVVVDDYEMKISHVLRAEEWLPSTPRHLHIYDALGYQQPKFGHLPMILGPDREKLSKRHGATSILEYKDTGYLPQAMANFMVLLGWSLDDKTEVMSRQTVVDNFDLRRVSRSGAIFDQEKLAWMNGVYIREMDSKDLANLAAPFLAKALENHDLGEKLPDGQDYWQDYWFKIVPLIQERIKLLSEVWDRTGYFFQDEIDYEPDNDPTALIQKGMDKDSALTALSKSLDCLASAPVFQNQPLEESLREVAHDVGLTPRQFFGVLRTAVTGRNATPPLFETIEVLGRELVVRRVAKAGERLSAAGGNAQ